MKNITPMYVLIAVFIIIAIAELIISIINKNYITSCWVFNSIVWATLFVALLRSHEELKKFNNHLMDYIYKLYDKLHDSEDVVK